MYSKYLIVLGVLCLNNVICHNSKRHTVLSNSKNAYSKNEDTVIAARYKIKNNKPIYDPTIAQNIHSENFPEVEYPSSVVDSSRPFYMNSNPFSNDVKSTFNSLASGGNTKPRNTKSSPTIVVNLKSSEKGKEKNKTESATSQTLDRNSNTCSTENKTNEDSSIFSIFPSDDTEVLKNQYSDEQLSSEEQPDDGDDDDEMEYVIGFIEDLDEFMTAITNIEREMTYSNNTEIQGKNKSIEDCKNNSDQIVQDSVVNSNESVPVNVWVIDENITDTGLLSTTEGYF